MDKKTEEMESRELLQEMLEIRRRDVHRGRITSAAVVLLAVALIVSLAILVPNLVRTLNEAHTTMSETQKLIQRADGSLDALDEITEKMNTILDNSAASVEAITGVVKSSADSLTRLANMLDSLDLDKLGEALSKLQTALDALSGFRLFG